MLRIREDLFLDQSLEVAVYSLVEDPALTAEDRACLQQLAGVRGRDETSAQLLDLLGLPLDDVARIGQVLRRRLGAYQLGRCVDTLARGLARHGVTLQPAQVRALAAR